MFDNGNTAFILGAGASWHYGYPTGADLVKEVIEKALIIQSFCERAQEATTPTALLHTPDYFKVEPDSGTHGMKLSWSNALDEINQLVARIRAVDPIVIDYFLGINPPLQRVGNLLIAWVLLECEAEFKKRKGNINRCKILYNSPHESDRLKVNSVNLSQFSDNWYRFITNKLITNCRNSKDLLRNNLGFITFNYDTSLEYNISKALRSISMFEDDDVDEFLNTAGRFIHIYGKIRQNPFSEPEQIAFPSELTRGPRQGHQEIELFRLFKAAVDAIYLSSKELRTIAPNKMIVTDEVASARAILEHADHVYILGYGFDLNNSRLLELDRSLRVVAPRENVRKISINFTNYNDINIVNKNASAIFFGNTGQFLPNRDPIARDPGRYMVEKSTRDVYGAFSADFDAPEERLDD